jgi:hypothetical protein
MAYLKDIVVDFVSFVDRAAVRDPAKKSDPQRFVIYKRDPDHPHQEDRMTPEETAALKKAQDDFTAERTAREAADAKLAKADEKITALEASVAEIQKAAGITVEPVPVDKSDWPESARIAFEKAEADAAALADRVAKAEKDAEEDRNLAKAERDRTLTASFIAKAEKFEALPVKAAEFGPILKSVHGKLAEAEAAEIDRVLKAADAAMTTAGLFKEHGRNGDAPAKADTAIAEITQKAEEIRKNDPKISKAAAQRQVFDADPDLARRYQDEQRAAA